MFALILVFITVLQAYSPVQPALQRTVSLEARRVETQTGGRFGVVVIDLRSGITAGHRTDERMPLESVMKLPVALAAYNLREHRRLSFDHIVHVKPADLVAHYSRITDEYTRGARAFTRYELIRRMLIESDNTAVELVMRDVGGVRGVRAYLAGRNLRDIDIRATEKENHGANMATPMGVALMFSQLREGKLLNAADTADILAILARCQTGTDRIRGDLPTGTVVEHKTGSGERVGTRTRATNDAGIIELHDGSIVIVTLLADAKGSDDLRAAAIAHTARAVYDILTSLHV